MRPRPPAAPSARRRRSNVLGFCCRQQEVIIPADLPLVQELRATLREWAQIWHKLFVVGYPTRC